MRKLQLWTLAISPFGFGYPLDSAMMRFNWYGTTLTFIGVLFYGYWYCAGYLSANWTESITESTLVGNSFATVSYTHLDVYKRQGQNNAINVKVQNVGEDPIDAVVRLFDIAQCPPVLVDEETLSDIGGGCCAQNAVLTANAGDFEVVICPDPADATIRAFVSVHSGNAPTAAIDYVIKASEMLPVVCDFCGGVID